MISGAAGWEHTCTHTTAAHRALLLKWSKLPGVKQRLLLKKDRERLGREKEGEVLRIVELSREKSWKWQLDCGKSVCVGRDQPVYVCVLRHSTVALDSGKVHAPCVQVQMASAWICGVLVGDRTISSQLRLTCMKLFTVLLFTDAALLSIS